MSDTEEESTSSDSWPVNEDWLMSVLKEHHKTNSKIKITVINFYYSKNLFYKRKSYFQDFSVKQGNHTGVSNLSDILAVSVDYQVENESPEDTQRLDAIIKLLPHDPFSRYFVTEAEFDLREIKFYTTILPELLKFQEKHICPGADSMIISVPKCYFTHYTAGRLSEHGESSPEAPESILVLQDMRPHGFKVNNLVL